MLLLPARVTERALLSNQDLTSKDEIPEIAILIVCEVDCSWNCLKLSKADEAYALTEKEVTNEEVNRILEAATWAPSACNKQSWRFVVIRKTQTIEKLYKAASYSTQHQIFVKKAKVVVVVCTDLNVYKTFAHKKRALSLFAIQETAAATQNLLLAAHALGLGACWVSLFSDEQVSEALNLPKGMKPIAIIPLDHTKSKTNPKPRKTLKDIVHYETF